MPKTIELTAKEIESINNYLETVPSVRDIFKGLKVGKHIATGGQATVYTLIDKSGREDYVVKVLYNRDEDQQKRLVKIKNASDELLERNCHNICKVEQIFITSEPTVVYCYIERRRICLIDYILDYKNKNSIGAFNKIAPQVAIRVAVDLLEILMKCEYNHEDHRIIIFRDIKIGNMFLASLKISDGIFLGDLGSLTHRAEKSLLTSVSVQGTGPYKSPELYAKDAGLTNLNFEIPAELNDISKSDMYSLGVTLYYILSNGHYPFASTSDRFLLTNRDACPRAKFGSEELKDIVAKALRYNPADRFKSCADMYSQIIDTPEFKQYISPFVDEPETEVYNPNSLRNNDENVVTKETISRMIQNKMDKLEGSSDLPKKSTPSTTKPKNSNQINFDNGNIYVGDVLNGKMHGKGTYTWSSGDIYIGDFANNEMTGFGKLIYSDKSIYEGCIINGLWDGMIKVTYPDSSVFEASYKNGELQGTMKPINSNHTSSTNTKRNNLANTIVQAETKADRAKNFVSPPSSTSEKQQQIASKATFKTDSSPNKSEPQTATKSSLKKFLTVVHYIMWTVWIAIAIAGLVFSGFEIGVVLIAIASLALLFLGQKLIHKGHKRWAWLPIIIGGVFLSTMLMMFDSVLGAIFWFISPPVFYFSCLN